MFRFSIPIVLAVLAVCCAPATAQLRITGQLHLGGGVRIGAVIGHHHHHHHRHHHRHYRHGYQPPRRFHRHVCHSRCGCAPVRVYRRPAHHRGRVCGPRYRY